MNKVKQLAGYVKSNWKEPQKEGNQVSLRSFLGINIAAMGIEGATSVFAFLSFTSTSAVLGLIFGLSLHSTYIISSLGTVINLLFVPVIANITDNIGLVGKATLRKIHLGGIASIFICAVLWFIPSTAFDFLLTDLFKHISIIYGVKYISIYAYLIMYKLFGQKYGKYKPWVIFMGIPSIVFSTLMVYLPYQQLRPSQLLLAVSVLSTSMTVFSLPYSESYRKMRNLMTQNNKERTLLYSVLPVLAGLLSSITTALLPTIAALVGYEINSIELYKIVVPAFGIISIITSFFIMWSDEKVKTVPEKPEERLGFKETITTVFSNKYLWITKIASTFGVLSSFNLILFNWMLIYSLREQIWIGILLTLVSLPSTPGNLITPILAQKFDNGKLIIALKVISIILVCAHIPFIYVGNKYMVMVLMTILGMVTTFVKIPKDVLEKVSFAQALDYHEWKFGKRVDESANYFQYITVPFTLLLGYCSPYFMRLVGFVSDRDILYDSKISTGVFVIVAILYAFELLGNTIPYFFFDLDNKKLAMIKKDLDERRLLAKNQDETKLKVEAK